MSTPEGTRYVHLIKDKETRHFWQEHMKTSSLLWHTAGDWKTWVIFFGGLLAAGFGLLLQKLLPAHSRRSRHGAELPNGSEAPGGKAPREEPKNGPPCLALSRGECEPGVSVRHRDARRLVDILFATLRAGLCTSSPVEVAMEAGPSATFDGGKRHALGQIWRGLQVGSAVQHGCGHLPLCTGANSEPSRGPWRTAVEQSSLFEGSVPLRAILAESLVAMVAPRSNSGSTKEVQQAMVQKVLEEQPSSEADGTPVIVVDGVRFTAEVGFSVYRFFESIWTKVLLVLLDIILDANTVFTLIAAQQYRIALALQLVVSYSLLHQVMEGQIQRIFEAARASAARGLLRDDLIALLHQARGRGIKVSTAAQIPVQVFSILLSVHGLANFLYEQVDLELAEDDEEVTSSDDEGTSSKATWEIWGRSWGLEMFGGHHFFYFF
eukprot:s49_g81.t1